MSDPVVDRSDEVDVATINRQMAKGAGWMVAIQLVVRCIGLVSTVILARLLVPEDFGLVALAAMLMGALDIMASFSFDMALIRDQKADRSHYDTVWTLTVLRGIVFAALILLLADAAAAFFEEPRLADVLRWLSIAPFLVGVSNVGVVEFRKELEFHREFRYRVLIKLSAFLVTVVMAFAWRDYWALIAGMLGGRVVQVLLSFTMHRFRPRLHLSRCREILHFSKWLAINNILFYVSNRADTVIIGKLSGVHGLGLYNVAYEVSNLPTTELVWPIQRAIFPGYSKLNGDLTHLRRAYVDVLSLALLLSAPLGVGIGLVAEPLVTVFLGSKWAPAIPLIQALAIFGVIRVGFANAGSILLALGRASTATYLTVIGITVRIPLLLWGTLEAGAIGAAWALAASAILALFVNISVVLRALDLRWVAVIRAVWRTLLAVAVMGVVVWAAAGFWATSIALGMPTMKLAFLVSVGALTYVGVLLALWWASNCPDGAERNALGALRLIALRRKTA